jgi:hypothetical protein
MLSVVKTEHRLHMQGVHTHARMHAHTPLLAYVAASV